MNVTEKARISGRQLFLLIVGSVTVMGHLYMTPIVFRAAGRDGWLSMQAALAPALAMALILAGLARAAPGRSLVEISFDLLGRPLGLLVGISYACFFLLVPAMTIRGLMDFMATTVLPLTPPVVLGMTFLAICAYAVSGGLERLARVNQMLLPVLILVGLLAMILTFPFKDYKRLLPVMENGIVPVLRGSIPLLGLTGEMVAVAMIQPAVKSPASLWKYNAGAMILIAFMFMGPLTGPIAMFGPQAAADFFYPTYNEIEYINLGVFVQNLQGMSIILWLFGSFGRISLFYYTLALSAAQLLGLGDYRRVVLPAGAAILALSLFIFPNSLLVRDFLEGSYSLVSIGLGMVLPAALLAGAVLRRRLRR